VYNNICTPRGTYIYIPHIYISPPAVGLFKGRWAFFSMWGL